MALVYLQHIHIGGADISRANAIIGIVQQQTHHLKKKLLSASLSPRHVDIFIYEKYVCNRPCLFARPVAYPSFTSSRGHVCAENSLFCANKHNKRTYIYEFTAAR